MRNMIAFAALATLLPCAPAFSNETTIEVPQGSGVFPTVGQLNCLEEAGSGRFCAATYECADESGDLWGDLANHDGRRAIGVESPVARERDCTITVDGKAAVRWFVGFSPDGRNGELVGLTAKHDAEPPVVRRMVEASGGNGALLDWFYGEYGITPESLVRDECAHIRDGSEYDDERRDCARSAHNGLHYLVGMESVPCTRCVIELAMKNIEQSREVNGSERRITTFRHWFEQMRYLMYGNDRCKDYGFKRFGWPGTYPEEDALECCELWSAEQDRLRIPQ